MGQRLIDEAEARRRIIAFATGLHSEVLPIDTVMMLLTQLQTVDALSVIRCRDCFGRSCWEKDENGCDICLVSGLYVRGEDDYCPYGERKEGADNG